MGHAGAFAPPGVSAYELPGRTGLFSFMTAEELINWVLAATAYAAATSDGPWVASTLPTFVAALSSLVNRDSPPPQGGAAGGAAASADARRSGAINMGSTRCGARGAEITTYDSLDASLGAVAARSLEQHILCPSLISVLGPAIGSSYLATKAWAAYVALEHLFFANGQEEGAATARAQADHAAATLVAAADPATGLLPASLRPPRGSPGGGSGGGGSTGGSTVLPVIEGLVFPPHCGVPSAVDPAGRYKALVAAMARHAGAALRPGACVFATSGGWRVSSSSPNTWLSKLYLARHVAKARLGLGQGGTDAAEWARADEAHAAWLRRPASAYWAWSDQIIGGDAIGSRYYPRGGAQCRVARVPLCDVLR